MDDKTCKENIKFAEDIIEIGKIPDVYFWNGYLVGMRSHYYDNPVEHSTWLQYFDCKDIEHHSMGIGYRAGHSGVSFSIAAEIAEGMEQAHSAFVNYDPSQSIYKSVRKKAARESQSGCMVLIAAIATGAASFIAIILSIFSFTSY